MNKEELLRSLASIQYWNRWLVFFWDMFLAVFSSLLALGIISYAFRITYSPLVLAEFMAISIVAYAISFLCMKTYKGIIRHSAFTEVARIAMVSLLACLLIGILLKFTMILPNGRRFVLFLCFDFFITFFLLSCSRAVLILVYRKILANSLIGQERLLIFIDEADMRSAALNPLPALLGKEEFQVVGFLSIGERKSMRLDGVKLYSIQTEHDFVELTQALRIRAILFSNNRLVQAENERLVRYCERGKLHMYVKTLLDTLSSGKIHRQNLPEVRIEDLLGREEIKINLDEIANALHGKVVMVTGAAGSIGSELCRQLCSFQVKELVLFDSGETPMHNIRLELEEKFPDVHFEPVMGDVRMMNRVESIFKRFHPQIIFHAAAYKHVPLMEENPCEAVHTNVYGTRNVANMAVKYGVEKFIMISTDKAVNPTNVMGASKRLAEIYVQSLSLAINRGEVKGKTQFITTRFGNVLGSNGSVIPRFREQLANGGPLTVTHPDIIRYFMTIPEACRLVLEAAFLGKGGEIFVFDMGTPVKIADLARRMIELAGLVPGKDIDITYTGLRPGEKLYEELLATKENTLPTENRKIFRAKVREYDYNEINHQIDALTELAIRVEKMETVRKMKEIIPEFKSKNSVYETLDQ